MARAYSDEEKEAIKKTLQRIGKELFMKKGLKSTKIRDITKASKISQGGFYSFYQNKEELFFDIYQGMLENLYQKIFSIMDQTDILPEEFLRQAFYIWGESVADSKYFWSKHTDILELLDSQEDTHPNIYDRLNLKLVERAFATWRKRGLEVDVPPSQIIAAFKAVFVLRVNKDFIGQEGFDEIFDRIIGTLTSYLLSMEDRKHITPRLM